MSKLSKSDSVGSVATIDADEPKNVPTVKPEPKPELTLAQIRALPVDQLTIEQALQLVDEKMALLADQFSTACSVELSAYRAAVLTAFVPYASILWNDKGAGRLKAGCLEKMCAHCPSADPSSLSMAITVYQRFGRDVFMSCQSIKALRRAISDAKAADDKAENESLTEEQKKQAEAIAKRTRAIRHLKEALSGAIKGGLSAGEIVAIVKGDLAAYAQPTQVAAKASEPITVPAAPEKPRVTSKPHVSTCTCPECTVSDVLVEAA